MWKQNPLHSMVEDYNKPIQYHSTFSDYHKKLPCKKENWSVNYIKLTALFSNLSFISYSI